MTQKKFELYPGGEFADRHHLAVGRAEKVLHGEDTILCNERLQLYGVFDGLGGHGSGDIASKVTANAVDSYIGTHIPDSPNKTVKAIKTAIENAGAALKEVSQEQGVSPGLRTTASVLYFKDHLGSGRFAAYGQVGDSRIYHYGKGGFFRQLGWDESTKHGLTNSVSTGYNECRQADKVKVQEGDRFIICSDGVADLWRQWPFFEEVLRLPDPQKSAERFIELSYKHDDQSILVIDVL